MTLVPIAPPRFDVQLDIAYATPDNVTGAAIYGRAGCYLRVSAAERLEQAIAIARPLGLRFKVFDGFRPAEAQWRLWEAFPDPAFVADPRSGSAHSRGVAVDLTLIDARGVALEMGTAFDDFSARAHHGAADVSPVAQQNRALLLGIMTAAHWDWYPKEWWHYQLFDAAGYPLLSDSVLATRLMDRAVG